MKKLLSLMLIFGTLTFALPKKEAHAGIGIFAGTAMVCLPLKCDRPNGFIRGAVNGAIFAAGGALIGAVATFLNPATGVKIIAYSVILDAENESNGLSEILAKKYTFINNQQVINELASAVKNQYELDKSQSIIRLSEAETMQILEPAELSEGELALVVADFN